MDGALKLILVIFCILQLLTIYQGCRREQPVDNKDRHTLDSLMTITAAGDSLKKVFHYKHLSDSIYYSMREDSIKKKYYGLKSEMTGIKHLADSLRKNVDSESIDQLIKEIKDFSNE